MIDPREFIKVPTPKSEEGVNVSGTFICQECMESIGFATLDEDNMELVYVCAAGHKNVASL